MSKYTALLVFLYIISPSFAKAAPTTQRLQINLAFNGSLETHILGIGKKSPPYFKVIRSKKGLQYMLKTFDNIKNYYTHKKLHRLKLELLKTDFNKNMIIAILTEPTDNYEMEFNGFYDIKDQNILEVKLEYFYYSDIDYSITPHKAIYYKMLLVDKSNLPVVLKASDGVSKEKKIKKYPLKYISGKLFPESEKVIRLVSKRTRKGMIYYIKGDWVSRLKKYLGKKVTLRGRILNRNQGLYEASFEVQKIIKIHEYNG